MMSERELTFQVLISTVNQSNYDLLERMNIQSDAVAVNLCDYDSETEEINEYGKLHKRKRP